MAEVGDDGLTDDERAQYAYAAHFLSTVGSSVLDAYTCRACLHWNHWHDTADGSCEDPRCECTYRPKEPGHGYWEAGDE